MTTSSTLAPKIPLPELARRWGWSQEKLYRLVKQQRIPHVRIGRAIFFEESELEQWLQARRRAAAALLRSHVDGDVHESQEQECARLGIPVNHEFS